MTHGVLLVGGNRTHQENYAPVFADHPRCTLVAVTDAPGSLQRRIDLTRGLAEELQLPYVADLTEALRQQEVTLVSCCAEVEQRADAVELIAAAGKHIYLDKPLAASVADARRICVAIRSAGVTAQMFSFVHSTLAAAARRAVTSGEIGELHSIHVEVLFAKGHPGTVPEGHVRREPGSHPRYTFKEAKPEMHDIGSYAAGLACYASGRNVTAVSGLTGNYFFAEHARCNVDDFGSMLCTLEGGATATIVCGRFGWRSHPQDGPKRLVLVGSKGVRVCDGYQPRLVARTADLELSTEEPNPEDPMGMWQSTTRRSGIIAKRPWVTVPDPVNTAEVAAFIDAVEKQQTPMMHVELAAHLVEIVCGGYSSAATGTWTKLT